MKKMLRLLTPPKKWKLPVIIITGIFFGLVFYVFYISKAHSYISDKPETCVNCHIMAPQYASWFHSAHREYTNCNECHVPQDNAFNKYYFKAKDGLRHATIFTLRNEPQVISIKEAGEEVVQQNCIRCHKELVTDYKLLRYNDTVQMYRNDKQCWDCHQNVPHGSVNSLSSATNAIVPVPQSPVPKWLKQLMEKGNNKDSIKH